MLLNIIIYIKLYKTSKQIKNFSLLQNIYLINVFYNDEEENFLFFIH